MGSKEMSLIVDAHEDLAWNILTFGRDYSTSAKQIRTSEMDQEMASKNGDTLLGWENYQEGKVAIIFSTLFATPKKRMRETDWDTIVYADFNQAYQLYRRQVGVYRDFVDQHHEKFRLVESKVDLNEVLSAWGISGEKRPPVGLVILMEGGEGIRNTDDLEEWWNLGVRIIGPAWAGTRYCGGTGEPGPLTKDGFELLEGMSDYGFTLDISHMDEQAALQALDFYQGPMIASHANASALLREPVKNRLLTDQVIIRLAERDGIVGVVPFNRFLDSDWTSASPKNNVTLHAVVNQIDHICQITGDSKHAGIGTDFDGGFGVQSVPAEIDTIADLRKLIPMMIEYGYDQDDVYAVLGQNWIRHLHKELPNY